MMTMMMILGAPSSFCVFAILFSACGADEIFPEASSGVGNWGPAGGTQVDKKGGEMIEALMHPEENRCYGNKCISNDDCCVSAVCVDIEGVSGTCLPMYGKKFFQSCEEDKECGNGFVCLGSGNPGINIKTCQLEGRMMKKKAFNDPCSTSSECDTAKGLCCQVLRRHRMASKKVCHYFIDPMSCIGEVETDLKPLNFIPNPFFKARLG